MSIAAPEWLVLVHQLPPGPSNARVRTWRRLQDLGAVSLRNAAWVLPDSPPAREDFAWVRREIAARGGQATVLTASTVDEADRQGLVQAFRDARQTDYLALLADIRRLHKAAGRRGAPDRGRVGRSVRALGERLRQMDAIDFFAAPAGPTARQAFRQLEERMPVVRPRDTAPDAAAVKRQTYRKRVWVTRRRPGVDRMSSAWLIRRFIDPDARFAFAARDADPPPRQVAFDMFAGEFSHRGTQCTFEVLLAQFGLERPSLRRIAEIVHDVDLKDHRYQRPEAPTIGTLVEGIRQSHARDRDALEAGMALFEAMYRTFETEAPVASVRRRSARRIRKR